MNVLYGGIRGSFPVCDERYRVFGGETTAVLLMAVSGEMLLLDAGSGVRVLQSRLSQAKGPLPVLFTHYHLDHLLGLPNLGPLWQPDRRVILAAPLLDGRSVATVVPQLVSPPFWPLSLRNARARVEFQTLPADLEWCIGPFRVRWIRVGHVGECVAYRIEDTGDGTTMVLATDIEWARMEEDARREFVRFLRQGGVPDLLCMDGAYTGAEYPSRRGWGHSTWEDVVAVGRSIGSARVHVIHHSPDHDDEFLEALERKAQSHLSTVHFARQGEEVQLERG